MDKKKKMSTESSTEGFPATSILDQLNKFKNGKGKVKGNNSVALRDEVLYISPTHPSHSPSFPKI